MRPDAPLSRNNGQRDFLKSLYQYILQHGPVWSQRLRATQDHLSHSPAQVSL